MRVTSPKRKTAAEPDTDEIAYYVEELARTIEAFSQVPRIAGRIYAHLLMTEQPSLTLPDLTEQLGISKASASAMIRRLVEVGLVENVPVPGSRREHFRVADLGWTNVALFAARAAQKYADLADRGMGLLHGRVTPASGHLRHMRDYYVRLAAILEESLATERARTR